MVFPLCEFAYVPVDFAAWCISCYTFGICVASTLPSHRVCACGHP